MTNFKIDKYGDFKYQDAELGDVVRIQVQYNIGGYGGGPRGLSVSVTAVKIEKTEYGHSEAFALFAAGFGLFVCQLNRKNPKAIAALAEKLDSVVPELAALFKSDREAAKQMLKDSI